MAKKIKNLRTFTFKAYCVELGEQELKNIKNYLETLKLNNFNKHLGKFINKSECHYYAEKGILDLINANPNFNKIYLIYKISTEEDSNREDLLIELIYINKELNKIIID